MKNRNERASNKSTPSKSPSRHSYLESLKGNMVTMYRGGPESKTGKLLDVRSDYVAIYSQDNDNDNNDNNDNQNNGDKNNQNNNGNQNQNEQNKENSVIYYQVKHVKSISEDTKNNSIQTLEEENNEEIEFLQADSFTGIIRQLKYESIQINQGGPESKQGRLVGLASDNLALLTQDDGIVYYNLHHIKSICKLQSNQDEQNEQNTNTSPEVINQVVLPKVVRAANFQEVFKHMSHKWVAINRGGPEAMEGVLVENSGGHYTLVNNQEVLRIIPYHVRNISLGAKGSLKQNNQNNNEQNQENANTQANSENEANKAGGKKEDNRSSQSHKSDENRHQSSRATRDQVVRTIDYVWKR